MKAVNSPIRWIAAFEAFKGLVVVLATTGVLALVHHNLHAMVVRLMAHTHLNPAAHYPGLVLDAIDHLQDARLQWLVLGALAYAVLRFAEAWGLFFEKAWAEVLAAGSGAIYVPFELAELAKRPTGLGAALLVVNLAVVAVMLRALWRRRSTAAA
ncbi:DUF2127 domain-containing protein [Hydrogenophaga sp. A37]|uniref:DUF2127 domain-containing protein n=1 Tax=Hydrogenophaga sp. A37 TaxID=1945864 RepID=UPI00098735E3|nr:DUF2127 domain-containing protein [Hydrogenophaga sp. A37]OOG88664.1 hypothetical protein B0E41_02135 [Hydrogenophaga sp. A37]